MLHGEPLPITQSTAACPTGTHTLQSVLVDSENNIFVENIGTTSSAGTWTPKLIKVDMEASLGWGQFTIRCVSGGLVVRTSDPRDVEVVTQTNRTTAIKEYASDTITFSSPSNALCPADATGELSVFGTTLTSGASTRIEIVNFTSNSSGQWSAEVDLSSGYSDNENYYVTWSCFNETTWDSSFNNTSYHFKPKYYDYVALGDSYSAGEGSFNYDLPTYGPRCHNSSDSYPYYVAANTSYNTPDLVACSGAVTDDLFGYSSERKTWRNQFDQLGLDTQLVTLTIGGNDVGFDSVLNECTHRTDIFNPYSGWGCGSDTNITDPLEARFDALAGPATGLGSSTAGAGPNGRTIHSIASVLYAIESIAPDAKIYIGGYPHLFGSSSANFEYDGNAPGASKCVVLGSPEVNVSKWDTEWLNSQADTLNAIIEDAVDNASSNIDVTFVDAISAFSGSGLCDSGGSWIHGVNLYPANFVPKAESFHPNLDGMELGYGAAFVDEIN